MEVSELTCVRLIIAIRIDLFELVELSATEALKCCLGKFGPVSPCLIVVWEIRSKREQGQRGPW